MSSRPKPPTAAELGVFDVATVVTETYRLTVEQRGDELYFLCFAHEDHKPSASVNLNTGWWSCWSCGAGGDIINLGCQVLGKGRLALERLLRLSEPDTKLEAIKHILTAQKGKQSLLEANQRKDRIPDPSEYALEPLDYMRNRGFDELTLAKYDIRYVESARLLSKNGSFILKNSIAIPIYDQLGDLVCWCYRAISPHQKPRYFYTLGASLVDVLFGFNLCRKRDQVVVTEGALDAMYVAQCGFPAVAVLGATNMRSAEKLAQLCEFRKVVVFGDRDAAGLNFVNELGVLIAPHTSVSVARYQPPWTGDDPNSLTPAQVRRAVKLSIPFHDWLIRAYLKGNRADGERGLSSRSS